ncbi:MAG: redoxin domain-containing protein [Chloroflexi bacterium]|nr:redoxin domain-containing protein [Chloroflexota bacterium]
MQQRASWRALLRGVGLAVLMIGLGFVASWLLRAQRQVRVGRAAPDFTLPALNGGTISLQDYRGRVVLLNFWATWCTPCREEMPLLDAVHREYGPEVVVLAINVGESADEVQRFVMAHNLQLPIALDEDMHLSQRYGVRGYPTTFIIDPQGNIAAIHPGVLTREDILSYLQRLGLVRP